MSAPDRSPCDAAMAGLTQLLESAALTDREPADKDQAWNVAAAAVRHLRARLTEICEAGDRACNAAAASDAPDADKVTELNAIKGRVNNDAASASRAAVTKIVAVVQQLLDETRIDSDAVEWLAAQGFDISEPQPPPPITAAELS